MPKQIILFLAASPTGTSRLALDAECSAIERELRMVAERDFEFQSRWTVTVDELMHHLNALQPTVIHFSGHGVGGSGAVQSSSPARDVDTGACGGDLGGIYLEDHQRGPQLVTADALTKMIRSAATSVRLVVLNACYSDAQAAAVCDVVDCVVGMDGAIDDDTARAFAVSFYRALGYRRSVANAIEQAAATLAGRPDADSPRCRTRKGVDAASVILTGPVAHRQPWSQRLDAVTRLAREAHDRLTSDPFGAAARAQQAVEHIVSYLHEREIGADWQAAVDAKLRRIEVKLVIPPMVVTHFRSVLTHTSSVIGGGAVADAEPDLLRPCLGSLAVVIGWFFREYVKQPPPELPWGALERRQSDRLAAPDCTPVNSTAPSTVLSTGTRFATGIGELMSIWRPRPTASALRIEGLDDKPTDEIVFKIEESEVMYFIGRTEQRNDGTRNDFVLPQAWNSISRDQGTLVMRHGDVVLTNTSSKNNVFVRHEPVASGATRCLRHGDTVQIGRCLGTFSDGRYYATTPPAAIDRRTGLLSRRGLIAEIGGALATNASQLLLVIRCPANVNPTRGVATADPERKAVSVAIALHRHDPASPIARIGLDVAMVLPNHKAVMAMAVVAHSAAGAGCVSGFLTLQGTADHALLRLEACLGALSRIAISGREPVGTEDLSHYALVPTPLEAFAEPARLLFEIGGGAVLFALGDLEHVARVAPHALPILERELLEMLGARMGPRDLASFAGPGLLLLGTPGDAERVAREVAVAWHARGPVTANAIEIERSLSAHLLAISDLDDLTARAAALVSGEKAVLRASGLPAPLALGAIMVDEARDPIERASALVALAELSWKLLAFILVAAARSVDLVGTAHGSEAEPRTWPAPWRSQARTMARRLEGQPGQPRRLMDLAYVAAAADHDAALRDAMDEIAAAAELVAAPAPDQATVELSLPRLDKAVRELFTALAPLRGWTLAAIVRSEIIDADGTAQRIEYIDYTGPSTRGSLQWVTVMGFRWLERFTYLVRWDEGLAIALEPFVRCARDNELCLATALVSDPGQHRYRSVIGAREVEQPVTAKQLGMPTGRR